MPITDLGERRAAQRRYRQETPERQREKAARYREQHREEIAARARARRADPMEKVKNAARAKMKTAAAKGWVKKPHGTVFHHPDYSRPYYGCWVTQREHQNIHAGRVSCPPCVDYSEQIIAARKELGYADAP